MSVLFLDQSHIQLRRIGPKGPHVLAGLMDDVQFAGAMVLSFSIILPVSGWHTCRHCLMGISVHLLFHPTSGRPCNRHIHGGGIAARINLTGHCGQLFHCRPREAGMCMVFEL